MTDNSNYYSDLWDNYHANKSHISVKCIIINNKKYYIVHTSSYFIYLDVNNTLLVSYNTHSHHTVINDEYIITETDKKMLNAFKFYCANWSIKNV